MTNAEAAHLANRSVSTLRRYTCAWCGQSLLLAITGGCASVDLGHPRHKCDPLDNCADWIPERRGTA